jgi:hypothetical protein
LYEAADIMAKDFAKHFVGLRYGELGADKAAKLRLYHEAVS